MHPCIEKRGCDVFVISFREHDAKEDLVRKGKRPVAQLIDELQDLNGYTLIGLERLMEIVEDVGGRLSPRPCRVGRPPFEHLPATR